MPSKKKKYNARFPPARIKKIMQTDEDVGKVAAAVPVVISRALELFIDSLIMKSAEHTKARNAKTLSASHIKQIILAEKKFDFLKDLVANIPDVQATEDDVPECSTDHPPPKPRAKLPPLAPGQPPRPRGRPKKKREEDGSTASATPVKQSHIDEEIKYSGESEGSSSEFEEESDTEGKSSISTDTTTTHAMPSVYPEQQPNLPGPSSHITSPTTFHTLLPATIPMSVDDSVTAPIPETLSALESQNILDQTNSVKYDKQIVGQTQQDAAAPTPVLLSLERANTVPSVKGIVSPPNISVQTSSPHTVSTTTSSVSGQFSGYAESSTTQNSWGLPDHQISKPPLNAESSAISRSVKTMNEAMVSDAYREAYQRISETSDSTMGTSGDSRVLNTSSPLSTSSNTAVFLKDQGGLYGDPSNTGEMKHGLVPESSHMKPHLFGGVQNGGNAISGQPKAMHSNQLHLETNMGHGTFEKWSPTKAGVLDLSVNKKVKAEVKTQGDMTSGNAPLNLAVTQDFTQNSNKDSTIHDRDTKSHITSQEVNKPITGQNNSELKGGPTRASNCTLNTNAQKAAPVTSMNMTGYPPPMMGLPGYPVMPGFPAYGMMPPYNGPNQFGGMTPQVMPPYAAPSGFYLPYQAAMMGYNQTTPSEKNTAQQSEKSATKPS